MGAAAASVDGGRAALRGLRVLLAEDEPALLEVLVELLQEQGCEVMPAADGVEALRHACAEVFDLLVTDLRMPRMDGARLIREVRTLRPWVPVLVFTGEAEGCEELGRDWEGPLTVVAKAEGIGALMPRLRALVPDRAAGG